MDLANPAEASGRRIDDKTVDRLFVIARSGKAIALWSH
jgi:hypothetical protein